MSRAADVFFGVLLIVALWSWMLLSLKATGTVWWDICLTISKIACACFITAPVYREYLR